MPSFRPALLAVPLIAQLAAAAPAILLRQGWAIQSSQAVHATGDAISQPSFPARDWYAATVPTTVLSALVEDHVYPDPYTGMNLRSLPGVQYPIAANFSNIQMPPESPFRHSWWYRTDFQLPADYRGKTIWLAFDGISFRANLWMNGQKDRVFRQAGRHVAAVRVRRHRSRASRRTERARRGSARAPAARSGDHLRRLESPAARQEHGVVARRPHLRHRPGGATISERDDPPRQR